MKLNIACQQTGLQKTYEIEEPSMLAKVYDKKIGSELDLGFLGESFKGYVVRVTGGFDNAGCPMMNGVILNTRTKLLLSSKHNCYHPIRDGARRRKVVHGCIIGRLIKAVNCIIVRRGETPLPGLTDSELPRQLGPKRADKIRKLFRLGKDDDVRNYVVKRCYTNKKGQARSKTPKIQRLVTPAVTRRRKILLDNKIQRKTRRAQQMLQYQQVLATHLQKKSGSGSHKAL